MSTVLVVDDERHAVQQIARCLSDEGYQVETAADCGEALDMVRSLRPRLVVLDMMFPEMGGLEVCRRIRQTSDVPIIILSARDGGDARICGFAVGADDYIAKPFNPRELVARMRAVLRRRASAEPQTPPPSPRLLRVGDLVIDLGGRDVAVAGRPVHLARKEFDVLVALAEQPGMTLSREALLSRVWGGEPLRARRTTDVHIAWLRAKLRGGSAEIQSVWGVGYRLVVAAREREPVGSTMLVGAVLVGAVREQR